MLDNYSSKIGTMNGIYEITDITYDFNERGRDVTLKCSLCGREIHRIMISGRNKWSELIKSCPCQKVAEEKRKQEEFEQKKRIERENILKDGKSMIGGEYGDYRIIDFGLCKDTPTFTLECMQCGDIVKSNYQRVKANAKTFRKCHKHGNTIKFDESYIGRKKNFLNVIGISRFSQNNHRAFVCECDCGNIKLIEPAHWEQGIVKSCGCKHDELLRDSSTIHGLSGTRLYCVWRDMIARCYNPNSESYKNYGERGITICDEWLNNPESFFDWAYSTGYDENAERGEYTIERKDVNGNYEPNNCEWITIQQQQKNKRTNVFITMNGETKILSDWHKETGISVHNLKKIASGNHEPKRTKKKNYGEFVRFRLTRKEKSELEEAATSSNITISEYVRRLIENDMKVHADNL